MTELIWNGPTGQTLRAGAGRPWGVQTLEGWRTLPEISSYSTPRSGRHGSYSGAHLATLRRVRATLVFRPWYGGQVDALTELEAATGYDVDTLPTLLDVDQLGVRRGAYARCITRDVPQGEAWVARAMIGVTVEWEASDPHLYRLPAHEIETGPSTPGSGGLRFPIRVPMVFGTVSTGGSITLTNTGNAPAYPMLYLLGPVRGAGIVEPSTGRALRLSNSYTLAAGERLDIDTDNRAITLGGVSRGAVVTERAWYVIPPRGAVTLALTGFDMTASTRLGAVWYDTEV